MVKRCGRYQLMLMAVFGLIAMMACAMSVDYGATCIQQTGTNLFVRTYESGGDVPTHYSGYISIDGGLTWQGPEPYSGDSNELNCERHFPLVVSDPRNEAVQYRLLSNGLVERSDDGGNTWKYEAGPFSLSEAQRSYYAIHPNQRAYGSVAVAQTPQDIAIDKTTGNIIVVWGQAGAVVRTPSGQWQFVNIGQYAYTALGAATVSAILSGEAVLALAVPFLISGTVFLFATHKHWQYALAGLVVWVFWLPVVFLSPALTAPIFFENDGAPASFLYWPLLVALSWGGYALFWLSRISWRTVLGVGLGAVSGALLFYLPYWAWAWDRIPSYDTARSIALLAVAGLIVVMTYLLHRGLKRTNSRQLTDTAITEHTLDSPSKESHGN